METVTKTPYTLIVSDLKGESETIHDLASERDVRYELSKYNPYGLTAHVYTSDGKLIYTGAAVRF